jgi:DNA/RNA endonuclease G (NUC1)
LAASAWAEVCKGSKVSRTNLVQYDAYAVLPQDVQQTAIQTHLPFGEPACPHLLPEMEYVLCFDPVNRVPLWAAYRLRAEDVVSARRLDAFRTDPRLSEDENPACGDYAGSGYARGHLVPRDDMNRSPAAQANTFFLSNMAPQIGAFNGGIWSRLERLVREYAVRYGEVYVLTGSILEDRSNRLPSGRVAIPSRFYKVVVRKSAAGDPAAVAVVLPHYPFHPGPGAPKRGGSAADAYLIAHAASIREIEHLTGLPLFPRLEAESLKRAVASELWPRN